MVKATWNGAVLAESDQTIIVEGNHYFPPNSIKGQYFEESETHTACSWKGKIQRFSPRRTLSQRLIVSLAE